MYSIQGQNHGSAWAALCIDLADCSAAHFFGMGYQMQFSCFVLGDF